MDEKQKLSAEDLARMQSLSKELAMGQQELAVAAALQNGRQERWKLLLEVFSLRYGVDLEADVIAQDGTVQRGARKPELRPAPPAPEAPAEPAV